MQALWSRFAAAASDQEFYESWLALLAAQLAPTRRAVLVLGNSDTGPYGPAAFHPAGEPCGLFLADLAERALQERRGLYVAEPTANGAAPGVGICYPIELDGRVRGAVAFELPEAGQAAVLDLMRRLQWGVAWIELRLRRGQAATGQQDRERLLAIAEAMAALLAARGAEAGARALATELATRLQCDRVSVGVADGGSSRLLALSHAAEPGERMNLVRAVEFAMDEALDQGCTIAYPPAAEDEARIVRAHESLARAHGCANIVTVPFPQAARLRGALVLERTAPHEFDAATVKQCEAVVSLAAPALADKFAAERPLRRALEDAAHAEWGRWIGPGQRARKIAAAAALLLVLFFSFATGDYRVTADSTVEGTVRRVLVAPFDGFLASAPHRAGDSVKESTVVARLDDRDLQLERMRWQSQHAQYAKQHQDAVAQHDRAQAKILEAQMGQTRAQLALLEEQLARASIVAPFDGVLVSGDLSQSLGGTLRRGQVLFEITPLQGYRVLLEVDEADIAHVQVGQRGRLIVSAMPESAFEFAVTQVTAVSQPRDGRTTFRVEAALDQGSPRLRPGMKGLAKVEAGERKLIWIWTHRFTDWLRLWMWNWFAW